MSCTSCEITRKQNEEDKVTPTVAQIGEKVVFYYNIESTKTLLDKCKDDSTIYIYVRCNGQNREVKIFNLSLENDSTSFIIPNNTAYLHYSFYTVCDAEEENEWKFIRVENENGNFVKNAFYDELEDNSTLPY